MNFVLSEFDAPHSKFENYSETQADLSFLQELKKAILNGVVDARTINQLFQSTSFPQRFIRLVLVLYAPGSKRIVVSRSRPEGQLEFAEVFQRLLSHSRRSELAFSPFRLQMDFVVDSPDDVELDQIGMSQTGSRHFEVGLDGLLIQTLEGKLHIFLPGDSYVRSIMGMGQLREYLARAYGTETIQASLFQRFRSISFVSTDEGWSALYRGHPLVGRVSKKKIQQAIDGAIAHIRLTQEPDGKFLYFYEASIDSKRDHEHPNRDPNKNPYYNILRHAGGALTCLFYERTSHNGDTWSNITLAIDYLLKQTRLQEYNGQEGAYIYHEKKSKLGGSGIALYLLAQYERVTGSKQYRTWADRLACHLVNQITSNGEFIYYNIYLDKQISESENQNYFSFFYPGEAICGLATYLHLLTPEQRQPVFEKLHKALEFLLVVRPLTRASEYSSVPSDGWLMMGIMEAWDFEEMRNPMYSDFVFSDAQKMTDHMYKVTDAPYPDYAGGFYYEYGDYPYADGARCEGLLGAYELAVKMNDTKKAEELWEVMMLASWALLHLVNTKESIYFAPKPQIALGGIRFKHTRQWFRIDTIQHVASFFAKLLPYWPASDHECR